MTQSRVGRRVFILLAVISLALVALAPVSSAKKGGPGPTELEVVGHISAVEMGVVFGENITDVWAFGNYAYLGTFDDIACTLDTTGTHIVDISNPADPQDAGFIADKPGTRTNDVKVAHIDTAHFTGEILVATNEPCGLDPFIPRLHARGGNSIPGQGGIAIWNVTDPTDPKPLRQNFLTNGIHNTYIWQDGANAYLIAVDDVVQQDVIIVDITKPGAPTVIAQTGEDDWPPIDNIGAGEAFLHDVWVEFNDNLGSWIAYLSYWDGGLVLLDVDDPANPVFLGDSDYADPDPLSGKPPEGNSHVAVPNADGTRVLMGDEDFVAGFLTKFDFLTDPIRSMGAGVSLFSPFVDGTFSGPVHWTGGEGCTLGEFDRMAASSDEIALIQRGTCFFSTKAANAEALGYAGFVVANDAARGNTLINMSAGTDDVVTIPGFFIGFDDGEFMKANEGTTLDVAGVFDGFGYLRLLDISDPDDIVELDQFATENVFTNPPPPGDVTMHNVVVDEGTTAYISWYTEGMRVVSFKNDQLKEVARFIDEVNGSNFWGVYLHDHPDGNRYILGSDRATGLWIFNTP